MPAVVITGDGNAWTGSNGRLLGLICKHGLSAVCVQFPGLGTASVDVDVGGVLDRVDGPSLLALHSADAESADSR